MADIFWDAAPHGGLASGKDERKMQAEEPIGPGDDDDDYGTFIREEARRDNEEEQFEETRYYIELARQLQMEAVVARERARRANAYRQGGTGLH